MKRNKYIYTLSLGVFLFLVVSQVYAEKNVLKSGGSCELTIWTEKEDFLLHEPIWTYMRLANNSAETLYVNASSLPQGLRVKAIRGREVSQCFHSGATGRPGTKPGESFVKWVDLSGWWGIMRVEISDGWRFIPAGRYQVWIEKYCPQAESNVIKSDTIEITVSEPKGEELAAWNLLTEGLRLSGVGEAALSKFKELAKKYPKSVYAPKALHYAAGCYHYVTGKEEAILELSRELIDKYPDSPYIREAFHDILFRVYSKRKDKDGAIKEMQALIKKHPNTDISKRAESAIKVIQEKW